MIFFENVEAGTYRDVQAALLSALEACVDQITNLPLPEQKDFDTEAEAFARGCDLSLQLLKEAFGIELCPIQAELNGALGERARRSGETKICRLPSINKAITAVRDLRIEMIDCGHRCDYARWQSVVRTAHKVCRAHKSCRQETATLEQIAQDYKACERLDLENKSLDRLYFNLRPAKEMEAA